MMGFVHKSQRFYLDYSMTLQELLLRVLQMRLYPHSPHEGMGRGILQILNFQDCAPAWYRILDIDHQEIDP